jgi:hypothetical protein
MSRSSAPLTAPRSFADGVSLPDLVPFLREGVYLMRADGALLDANPVALDLFGVAGVAGAHPRDDSRPPATWRAELDALAADGQVREFTREFVHADGTRRTVLDTCFARRDGESVTFLGVLQDITVAPAGTALRGDDAIGRDAATGAYTADYLAQLEADPNHAAGLCVVQVDPPADPPSTDQPGTAPSATLHDAAHALDARLERLTRFLLRHIRAGESVVRTGPHELTLVLPRADDASTETVARRLQLAALRGAPASFRLGWCACHAPESLPHALDRARHGLIPVRVVEREFQPPRSP